MKKIRKDVKEGKKTATVKKLISNGFVFEDEDKNEELLQNESEKLRPSINFSYIMPTNDCNFACKYCYIKKKKEHLSKTDADKTLKVLYENFRQRGEISFYGGEPLLAKKMLFYIIKKASKWDDKKIRFSMVTNGSLVSNSVAKKLKKFDVNVSVSLDGWKDLNDQKRVKSDGSSTFNEALRGFFNLQDRGLNPGISCTLGDHNLKHLEEVVDFFHSIGVTRIGFNPPITKKSANTRLITLALYKAFKKAKSYGIYEDRVMRRYIPFCKEEFCLQECVGNGHQIAISPDGKAAPCQAFFNYRKLNQIPLDSVGKAENNDLWKKWAKRSPITMEECKGCELVGVCGGGCAYNAYLQSGNISKPDKQHCKWVKPMFRLFLIPHYFHEKVMPEIKYKEFELSDGEIVREMAKNQIKEEKERLKTANKKDKKMIKEQIKEIKGELGEWDKVVTGWCTLNLAKFGVALMALSDKKVVAFCSIAPLKEYFEKGEFGVAEMGTGVLNGYEGKVAENLIRRALQRAREINIHTIYVEDGEPSKRLRKAFKRANFRKTGKTMKVKLS